MNLSLIQFLLSCIKQNYIMKLFFTFLLLSLSTSIFAQERIFATLFNELPSDYQLYPRKENNLASVPISGQIEIPNWQYVSVWVYKGNTPIYYKRAYCKYQQSSVGTFKFDSLFINAELSEYSFHLSAVNNNKDSVFLTKKEHIVAGDVYVINGQSNALAIIPDGWIPYVNKFARSYGAGYPWVPMTWSITEYDNYRVGRVGGTLQKFIIEKYKIPVCIINGAEGGISIDDCIKRNPADVGDLSTYYGLIYNRLKKAKLLDGITAYIFRQGEFEASGGAKEWESKFKQLYNQWHTDYPSIKKYYVIQISLLKTEENNAGLMRDFQRRVGNVFSDVSGFTCVGTKGYDGIHYDSLGYAQTGYELFRLIDTELYKGTYKDNVYSPNVRKAYFSNEMNTEITLEFDTNQKMVWQEDSLLLNQQKQYVKQYMKDQFFVGPDRKTSSVASGKAVSNKIILTLKRPILENMITYLPPFNDSQQFQQFGGPFLSNITGMRAFSFDQVPITEFIPIISPPNASVQALSYKNIKLSWNTVPYAKKYQIDRKNLITGVFETIIVVDSSVSQYTDDNLQPNTQYTYRIKAIGQKSESDYTVINLNTQAILGIENWQENASFILYPNPVNDLLTIRTTIKTPTLISILRADGQLVLEIKIEGQSDVLVDTKMLPAGKYVLVDMRTSTLIGKLSVIH